VGLSVSRVGGKAQTKAMKQVAGRLRMDLAQYRELAAFAQFGTQDLDRVTRAQLERGQRTVEILKQPQYTPMSLGQQVEILYAISSGHLDDVAVDKIGTFEDSFHQFMQTSHPDIEVNVNSDKALSDDTEAKLKAAVEEFKLTFKL
ncbi:MAG: F0F1 ATP synthase subunit alpha, partial [Chloroflexota bacterium]